MKYRYVLIISLLFATLGLPLTTVRAQTEQQEMQVTPYFNGYFKYGEWLPLDIELENLGDDVEAEIQARIPGSAGGVTYTAPVSLPAGAHKRVTLYILPNNYSHALEVRLVHEDEVLVSKKVDLHPIMNINVMVGLVAANRQALSLVQGIEYPNNMRPVQIVDVSLEQFPEHAEGLNSFDVLVLNDVDTSILTPEQSEALKSWVHGGGRLVLGGGTGAARTLSGLSSDMLPVQLTGENKVDGADISSALSEYAGTDDFDSDDVYLVSSTNVLGKTILKNEDMALISELSFGTGYIDFVALDLSAAPFDGWAGTVEFWESLLRSKEDQFEQPSDMSRRSMMASNMEYPLTNIPMMELPSVKWLVGILMLYILIIGPVNYFLLKRKNRLHLAWVTIPGITLVFSAAAFGSGYLMRGNNILIHKIGIVEIQSPENARLSSFMGLFSPSQTSYQIEVAGDSLLSPLSASTNYYSNSMNSQGNEITLVQGDPMLLKGLSVNQWSMQSFMTEQIWQGFGTLSGDLMVKDGKLVGTLKNETNQDVKDVVVILQNFYQRVGDVAVGEQVEVNLDFENQVDSRDTSIYYRLYDNDDSEIPRNERDQNDLKRSIVSSLFSDSYSIKMLSSSLDVSTATQANSEILSRVLVLGWIDYVPPEVTISTVEPDIQTTGLVYTYLDYQFPKTGFVNIPPGLLQGTILETDGGMCGAWESISLYLDRDNYADVLFRVPDVSHLDFQELDLHLAMDRSDLQMSESILLSLFDWDKDEWVLFEDAVTGTNMVNNPEEFIDENGNVKVKLTHNKEFMNTGGCIYLDLGFKAKGKGDGK